jgi:hypothetical protein
MDYSKTYNVNWRGTLDGDPVQAPVTAADVQANEKLPARSLLLARTFGVSSVPILLGSRPSSTNKIPSEAVKLRLRLPRNRSDYRKSPPLYDFRATSVTSGDIRNHQRMKETNTF